MKKSRMMALVLALAMLLVLATGCGDQDTFVGSWSATLDMADQLNKTLAAGDPETAEYIQLDDVTLTIAYTFNKDGTYSMKLDEDSIDEAYESIKESLSKGMETYLVEAVKQQNGLTMAIGEILAQMGVSSMDELINGVMSKADFTSALGDFSSEGKYEVKDGKLYTSDSLDTAISETEYETYEILSDTQIKLIKPYGEKAEDEEMVEAYYPAILKKVG